MQLPLDAEGLFRPHIPTAAEKAEHARRAKEFPFTVEKARGRIAFATGDMHEGDMDGALNLSTLLPQQLQQTRGTTCFFRAAMNLAAAFGRTSSNPYIMQRVEGEIAEAAADSDLLNQFGANTHRHTPTLMEHFLQDYTHLDVKKAYPHGRYPDTQLVNALRDGNAVIGLIYRDDLQRQEWEAFYGIEKTKDGVLFHSAFSGDGQIRTRTGEEMAQALYGTAASPELWFVEVQLPFSTHPSGVGEKLGLKLPQ